MLDETRNGLVAMEMFITFLFTLDEKTVITT